MSLANVIMVYWVGLVIGIYIGSYARPTKKCPCCSYPKCGHKHEEKT